MKKAILTLLLVLVLGIVAGSYWLGLRAETALKDQLALVTADYGPRFEAKDASRGLFSSRYRYAMIYTLPPDPQAGRPAPTSLTVDLEADVAHGPLPVAAGTWKPALAVVDLRLAPDQQLPAAFNKFLDTFAELRRTSLRAIFGFAGDCRASLAVPASKHTLRDKDGSDLDVDFGGASATVVVAAKAAAVTGAMDIPFLDVRDKEAGLSLHRLSLRSDTTLHGQSLYLGASGVSVAEIRLTNENGKSFVLTNMSLEGNSRRREAVVDGGMSLRGQVAEGNSPQSLAVDMTVTVKNLDFAALDIVVGQWERISLEPVSFDVQTDKWEAVLKQQAGALLSREPSLTLDGPRLGLPSGNVALTTSLAYAGAGPVPQTFEETLGRATASAKLTADRPALRDLLRLAGRIDPGLAGPEVQALVEGSINDLIAQGALVLDKDTLTAKADWNGRVLTVNGRPLVDTGAPGAK